MAICSIDGCDRPTLARGWCGAHYRRWRKHGDPEHGQPLPPSGRGECRIEGCTEPAWYDGLCPPHHGRLVRHGDPLAGRSPRGGDSWPCLVEDCANPRYSRGYCESHYNRLRAHGDPLTGRYRATAGMTPEERFWHYVEKRGPSECWPWQGARDRKGYGRLQIGKRNIPAHRFAYELAYGEIPADHQVHHTCDNKPCCNQRHLKALPAGKHTLIGNGFSGANARKTHCVRGHPLTPENCYEYPGRRVCKLCARERARKQYS